MKTIVEEITGRVIAVSELDIPVLEGQVLLDTYPISNFLTPYWNFATEVFYEGATQNEIDTVVNAREDAEDQAEQLAMDEAGQQLIYRTKKRLIRRFKKGLITKAQAKKVREILNPIFQFLKTGDLDIANDKAIALPVDNNANVQGELTWFKARILEIQ
jgi:hypothetical protein